MNQTSAPVRPLPDTEDPLTKPFWEAARQRKLVVQRCKACGVFRFPPERGCYECGSQDSEWKEVSGLAKLHTWTVLHPPVLPFFNDKTPFPVAVVELDEGVRMATNLIGVPLEDYAPGLRLKADFEDVPGEDVTLVMFRRV